MNSSTTISRKIFIDTAFPRMRMNCASQYSASCAQYKSDRTKYGPTFELKVCGMRSRIGLLVNKKVRANTPDAPSIDLAVIDDAFTHIIKTLQVSSDTERAIFTSDKYAFSLTYPREISIKDQFNNDKKYLISAELIEHPTASILSFNGLGERGFRRAEIIITPNTNNTTLSEEREKLRNEEFIDLYDNRRIGGKEALEYSDEQSTFAVVITESFIYKFFNIALFDSYGITDSIQFTK